DNPSFAFGQTDARDYGQEPVLAKEGAERPGTLGGELAPPDDQGEPHGVRTERPPDQPEREREQKRVQGGDRALCPDARRRERGQRAPGDAPGGRAVVAMVTLHALPVVPRRIVTKPRDIVDERGPAFGREVALARVGVDEHRARGYERFVGHIAD